MTIGLNSNIQFDKECLYGPICFTALNDKETIKIRVCYRLFFNKQVIPFVLSTLWFYDDLVIYELWNQEVYTS